MRKSLLLITVFLLSQIISNAQDAPLSIRLGWVRDTVYNQKCTIIGATAPEAVVTFNGTPVKVYKTGSFGWQGELGEGDNRIIVNASKNNVSVTDTVNIFYSTTPRVLPQNDIILKKDTSLYVMTTAGAFFNYSDGNDRLGGSKVSFLCDSIPLEVIEQNGDLYKVKVSSTKYFYIPIEYTIPTDIKPYNSNSGTWSVDNMGDYDQVFIALGGVHPYTFKQIVDPLSIWIDIYGVQCNSNWITQHLPLDMIEYVDFEQVESDVLRVKIKLKEFSWGTRIRYDRDNLVITVMHAPEKHSLKGMIIGVDAGHGGPTSSGAISISGMKEKDLNLEMAYTLKKELEKRGATVVLSRTDDSSMTMAERKKKFLDNNIDLLVSIHCNAGGSPFTTGGASTYYKYIHNRTLAELILKRTLELDGVYANGLVGNFNFSLNGPMEYPNVLVETQFLSNFEDEERIAEKSFRDAYMKKVVLGIEDYLKFCKNAF